MVGNCLINFVTVVVWNTVTDNLNLLTQWIKNCYESPLQVRSPKEAIAWGILPFRNTDIQKGHFVIYCGSFSIFKSTHYAYTWSQCCHTTLLQNNLQKIYKTNENSLQIYTTAAFCTRYDVRMKYIAQLSCK
jgi:hypothetical protein